MTQRVGYKQYVYEQEAHRIPDEISRMLGKVREYADGNEEELDWTTLRITVEQHDYSSSLGSVIEVRLGLETKP